MPTTECDGVSTAAQCYRWVFASRRKKKRERKQSQMGTEQNQHPQAVLSVSAACGQGCAPLLLPPDVCRRGPTVSVELGKGRAPGHYCAWGGLWWRPALAGSVLFGSLSLDNVLMPLLLFLLLPVTCLNHLGQFPGQQRAGDEEGRERQYDSGEETVGVFGGPLHHVLRPCSYVNHAVFSR